MKSAHSLLFGHLRSGHVVYILMTRFYLFYVYTRKKCHESAHLYCHASLYICVVSGTAIRHCNEEKGWLVPELFNCTTITFAHLKKMVRL